jgi:hypothetical protein
MKHESHCAVTARVLPCMRRVALSGQCATRAGIRLIPCPVRKTLPKVEQDEFLDAEAITEAVTKENMRFVPIKSKICAGSTASVVSLPRSSMILETANLRFTTAISCRSLTSPQPANIILRKS